MPTDNGSPVTIIDVARAAGVSKTTVSRALRNDPDTSAKTREHVLATAREIGYVVNTHAQALRKAGPSIVGAVLRDSSNPIYGALHVALQRHADAHGMTIVAVTAVGNDWEVDRARAVNTLLEVGVNGLLICSGTIPASEIRSYGPRVPLIALARPGAGPGIHSIAYDEAHAGRSIAEAIVNQGHRRVAAHVIDEDESYSGSVRTKALVKQLTRYGIEFVPINFRNATHDPESELEAAMANGATVMACANDNILSQWIAVALARGIKVPGQLSLIGCDGVGALAAPILGFSTFRMPVDETARKGVELMRALLNEGSDTVSHSHVRGHLVSGRTLGPAATA